MDDQRLVYVPREDATPEGELAALAAVYAFVLEHHKQKEIAAKDGGDEDGTEAGHPARLPKEHPDDGDSV